MKPAVSICCITYNQKDYIKDALERFLSQEFKYPYEILIHDDASTDGTTEILKEYQKKYPDKIILMLEEENQYSKGAKMFHTVFQRAAGKYLAICEGDDYWCDNKKLTIQYEFMEQHPEYTYLCHAAYMKICGEEEMKEFRGMEVDGDIILEEVLVSGRVFPTASLFLKREDFLEIPDFYLNAPVEDEPIKLLGLLRGNGFYMNRMMCVYRKNYPGSWNSTVKKERSRRLKHHQEKKQMYQAFDEYTQGIYHEEAGQAVLLEDFNIVLTLQDYRKLREKKYRDLIKGLNKKDRLRLTFASYVPGVYRLMLTVYKWKKG